MAALTCLCHSWPFALLMHQCQSSASLPRPVLMETGDAGCPYPPFILFFFFHHPNFPDVAATRNKLLNEHLSAGDSFWPCEGLCRGCGGEVSPPPSTACDDVEFTRVKKSFLLSSKQQPASAALHLNICGKKDTLVMVSSCIRAVIPLFPDDAWVDTHSAFTSCLWRNPCLTEIMGKLLPKESR